MKKEAFIYTWSTEDEETLSKQAFHIRMYGIDEENMNICIHVRDFMPYFYLELENVPENDIKDYEKGITHHILYLLHAKHTFEKCEKGGCRECWMGRITFVYGLKKLYFHHPHNSFGMIKMEFVNNLQRKKAYYKLQEKKIQVGFRTEKATVFVHENEANPILQFCTQQHIDTAGWIRWSKDLDTPSLIRQSSCHREITKKFNLISPIVDKDKPSPSPYVISFDIEVYSSVPTRMPDAEKPEDVIFQISLVGTRDQKDFKSYLLSLGRPNRSVVGKNVILKIYPSEKELLLGFTQILRDENPNVVIGYNIFGFDMMYMIARSKFLGIMPFFDQMGARIRDRNGQPVHSPEKTINWSSSAYSHQNFMFLDTEGRLFVDLLPVVRRDYKFENYRLKTISEHFIGETKDPIKPKDIFEGYRLSTCGDDSLLSRVGKYCVQDSRLVLLLFEKLQLWIGLTEMAKTCRVPVLTLYTQGQQIKVFSQLYYLCTHDKIVVQSPNSLGKNKSLLEGADHYSGAYVFPPDPGVYDWVIPFDFTSLYPSCIIAYNIDFSTLVTDPSIPNEKCHLIEWWDHIGCEHDTTVHATKPKQIVCQQFSYRFLKEPTGVIPQLLKDLLSARSSTKKQMKEVGKMIKQSGIDENEKRSLDTLYNVYDKRQLAYKVSANSMYGAMGVKRGYLPFLPGAMCTTAMGRYSIQKAADHVQTRYNGRIVYGDTDSIYCHFPLPTQSGFAMKLWEYAKRIETELLDIFPRPMQLAFEEKIYKKFLILTKKRYMALTCDQQGNDDHKLTIRGVLLARRDNPKWVRNIYEKVVRSIMSNATYDNLVSYLNDEILHLFRNYMSISFKQFIVSKTLGKDYAIRDLPTDEVKRKKRLADLGINEKNPNWEDEYRLKAQPAHAQLATRMKNRGSMVEPGSRIEYVLVQHPETNPKLSERIEDPSYVLDHSDLIKIDPIYYAQNLINPVDQTLEVCFKKKRVVENMIGVHLRFKMLLTELTWHFHPYEFIGQDGNVLHHPSTVKFLKKKKKTPTKKKKETTTPPEKKKRKDKDKVSVADIVDDLLPVKKKDSTPLPKEKQKKEKASVVDMVGDLLPARKKKAVQPPNEKVSLADMMGDILQATTTTKKKL